MKHFISVLLLFIALIQFFSCESHQKSSEENDLKYKIVTFERKSEGCDSLSNDNCAEIKIEFPQITFQTNKSIEEKINKSIRDLVTQDIMGAATSDDIEMMMSDFIEEYDSFKKEFPDAYQSWFIERTSEVNLNKGNIFSIDYLEYSFTGGAHPNTYVTFKNFNLLNGEEITLDEIISADKKQELTNIAETEFRKLKDLTTEADLGQAGFWFENNKFYLNDNFLITDSSLIFYYNNYEITAYAFGPTKIILPYSKIKSLIEEKSLLSGLIE